MAFYFTNFPRTQYNARAIGDNNRQLVDVQNILRRFVMKSTIVQRTTLFYEYDMRQGETLQLIAAKYFGDERLDWVLMVTNLIINPKFDVPLDNIEFEKYIRKKYGSFDSAVSQIQRYEMIDEDGNYFTIDQNTYNTLPNESKTFKTFYDYEVEENTKKGSILVLRRDYLGKFLEEAETIIEG